MRLEDGLPAGEADVADEVYIMHRNFDDTHMNKEDKDLYILGLKVRGCMSRGGGGARTCTYWG